MDPQTAWDQMLDALEHRDYEAAAELADGLRHWLEAGGFPPETIPGRPMSRGWNVALATAACRIVPTLTKEPSDGA